MVKRTIRITRLTNKMRGKLGIVFFGIVCLFLVLVGKLIYLNVNHGDEYKTMVLSGQKNASSVIPFERGKIYDRDGNLLATNEKMYALILEPKNILEKDSVYEDITLDVIQEYMGYPKADLRRVVEDNPNSFYVIYKKNLTYDQVGPLQEFLDLADKNLEDADEETKALAKKASKVRGISFEESYKRIYPYNSLACRILGFTSAGNVGNWGIEQSYNNILNGTNGRAYYYFNQELVLEQSVKEAENGNSVVSTIDMQIQQILEKKVAEFDAAVGSEMTSILVMNPQNGEILGMASSNPYNLNEPMSENALRSIYSEKQILKMKEYTNFLEQQKKEAEAAGLEEEDLEIPDQYKGQKTIYDGFYELWRNTIISDTNEPGSTYKPFTVAAGLESGNLNGHETYFCAGSKQVGRRSIGCSHIHGDITLKQAVSKSCNVAMMNIAFKEGPKIFYSYQNQFGFGRKSQVDLPGEADTSNLVYNLDNYSNDATLATNAFGQNFNCTMIQMATGFASLINGGNYYRPHIVKQIQNDKGDVVENINKELVRKTVSERTSRLLRSYLKDTVETGTGVKAQIEGYSIGGKTGTAEKIPRNKEDYYISFMGFYPVEEPSYLIYVTIDEPHVKEQANAALAVNLEREVMESIFSAFNIEPEKKKSDN